MMNILENLCVVGHAGDVLASKRIVSVCLLADLLAGGSPGSQAGFSLPPPSNSHSSQLSSLIILLPLPNANSTHPSQQGSQWKGFHLAETQQVVEEQGR